MKTYDEIYQSVAGIMVDVLAVEPNEVTPQATFFDDLDGESIDLLDAQFRIGKELGLEVDLSKLLASSAIQTSASGTILPESLRWLHDTHPFLKCDRLPANPTPENLKLLLTVEAIARFVQCAQSVQTDVAAVVSHPSVPA